MGLQPAETPQDLVDTAEYMMAWLLTRAVMPGGGVLLASWDVTGAGLHGQYARIRLAAQLFVRHGGRDYCEKVLLW